MAFTTIIIDYYLQRVESGETKEEAAKHTHNFMYMKYRERLGRTEYLVVYEMIDRLSRI